MAIVDVDPGLAEEAVFLALRERPAEEPAVRAWDRERDELYRLPPGPERDRGFRELARAWLARLDLARPVERALAACPCARAQLSAIHVRRARRPRDEGSDLFSAPRAGRPERMILAALPRRFLEPARLEELALCELLHAEDILDPAFGFEPVFDPDPAAGHARRELLRDRFQVLWEVRVRGRMARLAGGGPAPEALALRAGRAFAGARVDALVRSAWSGELASRRALLDALLSAAPDPPPG